MADLRDRAPRGDATSAFRFEGSQHRETIPELLRELAQQGSHLAEQQTKLIEAEIRSSTGQLAAAAGAMAGAGVVAIAGLGVLLMGLSFLLATALPLWAATLLVAAATLVVAYVMFAAGRNKIAHSSLSMERSRRMIERTPAALSASSNESHHHDR